jgi:hypothetical protein
MSDKELVLEAIERLPAKATFAEIRGRIEFLAALQEAETNLAAGRGRSQEAVEKQFKGWAKQWHSKSSGPSRRSKISAR